jgi:hypothetical protein
MRIDALKRLIMKKDGDQKKHTRKEGVQKLKQGVAHIP